MVKKFLAFLFMALAIAAFATVAGCAKENKLKMSLYVEGALWQEIKFDSGSAVDIPEPSVEGKRFECWFEDQAMTKRFTEQANYSKSFSLYAYFIIDSSYSIEWNLGGGSNKLHELPEKAETGEVITLPSWEGFERNSEGVSGWSDGLTVYAPGTKYTMPAADIRFTAVWSPFVNVKFNSEGGSEIAEIRAPQGVAIDLPVSVKSGYTLFGYSAGDVEIPIGMAYIVPGNITLTALWSGAYMFTYISVDPVTQAEFTKTVEVVTGTSYPFPELSLGGDGAYKLSGWHIEGDEELYKDSYTAKFADVTFYALWTEITYKATFTDWDGTVLYEADFVKAYNLEEIAAELIVNSVAEFTGWANGENLASLNADTVFTAKYSFPVPNDPTAFGYVLGNDGTYTINLLNYSKYTYYGSSSPTVLYLPATYNGALITAIADGGMTSLGAITEAYIPSTYVKVGASAFDASSTTSQLRGLTVVHAESVREIGKRAFYFCTSLQSIDLKAIITISDDAFRSCYQLSRIDFPEGLQSLGVTAFYDTALSDVNIPASLTSIGQGCFYMYEHDGYGAKLNSFTVAEGNKSFSVRDGVLYNYDGTLLIQYPTGREQTSFEIPAQVTVIGQWALASALNLRSVTFAEGTQISRINRYAFTNDSFAEFVLPADVDICEQEAEPSPVSHLLMYSAFSGAKIGKFFFAEGTTYISAYAFRGAYIGEIILPSSLEQIDDYAFARISSSNSAGYYTFTTVSFSGENNIKHIGDYALYGNRYFTTFDFAKVETIGEYAFSGDFSSLETGGSATTNNITALSFPATLKSIGDYAFSISQRLVTLEFADDSPIEYIGVGAFGQCINLETVTFGKGSGSDKCVIQSMVFYKCTSLTSVELPEKLYPAGLGGAAFMQCEKLKTVDLGQSLTAIGNQTFDSCYELESITCGNLTQIAWNAFRLCRNISQVNSLGGLVLDGYALYDDNTKTLLTASTLTTTDGVIEVREGTQSITAYAFSEEKYYSKANSIFLTKVTIPDSVREIALRSFYMCLKLTSVDIGENSALEMIDEYAFAGNDAYSTSFTEIRLPSGLKEIGSSAFYNSSLVEVTIPASLERFRASITDGDGNISYNGNGGYIFAQSKNLRKVTFESGCKVGRIGAYAFNNCSALEEIFIGDGCAIAEIVGTAFTRCSALINLTVLTDVVPSLGSASNTLNNAALAVYVKPAMVEKFKAATRWSDLNIQPYAG